MRTFDSLEADYRVSVPYIARVIRLDGEAVMLDGERLSRPVIVEGEA